MNVSWQDIAVVLIVIVAASSIIYRLVQRTRSRHSGGCAGCNCCEKATAGFEPTLIELPSQCAKREAGENATVR